MMRTVAAQSEGGPGLQGARRVTCSSVRPPRRLRTSLSWKNLWPTQVNWSVNPVVHLQRSSPLQASPEAAKSDGTGQDGGGARRFGEDGCSRTGQLTRARGGACSGARRRRARQRAERDKL